MSIEMPDVENLANQLDSMSIALNNDESIVLNDTIERSYNGSKHFKNYDKFYDIKNSIVKDQKIHIERIDKLNSMYKALESMKAKCQEMMDLCECNCAYNAACIPSLITHQTFDHLRGYIFKEIGKKHIAFYERNGVKSDALCVAKHLKDNFVKHIPYKTYFGVPYSVSGETNRYYLPFWIKDDINCYFCLKFSVNEAIDENMFMPMYLDAKTQFQGNTISYSVSPSSYCTIEHTHGPSLEECAKNFVKFLDSSVCLCKLNPNSDDYSDEEWEQYKIASMAKVEEDYNDVFAVWDNLLNEA